jgi:hypothetical protein
MSSKSISLPADIMIALVRYFDAKSWAKMAQVSSTWKKVAYRSSLWANMYWKPKPAYRSLFINTNEIPNNAKHIGEPTSLCFQAWLQTIFQTKTYSNFSKQFLYETKPEKKINYLYQYWQKQKPCVHINHHVWTDMFRGRNQLNSLEETEILRVYLRIIDPEDYETNTYRKYLKERIGECVVTRTYPQAQANQLNMLESSGILQTIHKKIISQDKQFEDAIMKRSEQVLEPYAKSLAAISLHGKVEFSNNDSQYKRTKIQMLDSVAFSVNSEQVNTL